MTNEELKEWFWNKYNSCYYVKHDDYPESLFMYYDVNFIRKTKFRILQGKEIEYPTKPSGICLFEHDYKNDWLRCDYNNIWSFFESNYNHNYQEIRDLLKGWLGEDTKLKVLTPTSLQLMIVQKLGEDTKIKVLTPNYRKSNRYKWLEEYTKLTILTK